MARTPASRRPSLRLISLPSLLFLVYVFMTASVWNESSRLPRFSLPDFGTASITKTTSTKTAKGETDQSQPPDLQKGETVQGQAVHIADGDTFDLLTEDKKKIRVRLSGIDAPEKGQDFGQVAKTALGNLMKEKRLKIVVADKDRYGRAVCDVYALHQGQKLWINRQLVADGMAWHYEQYSKSTDLAAAQQQARNLKKGLWAQPNPTPPWEWRKQKRALKF